ncbi:hypothetical protein HELRODRAFT_171047 [Helobdella robusta]|uniref:Phosphatase and actin regulator n=1 Tax=Helobdella robusta TaxID=6412 RepID=T1F3R0_HELRO|nr:hypothetical protein HELRODRAFT_171047 [Helobdella robusta]ESO07009.1 hypothetical protein HELRODRAFT_171047 [Helobdella robusta]
MESSAGVPTVPESPSLESRTMKSTLGKLFKPWKWNRKKKRSEKIEKGAYTLEKKMSERLSKEELVKRGVLHDADIMVADNKLHQISTDQQGLDTTNSYITNATLDLSLNGHNLSVMSSTLSDAISLSPQQQQQQQQQQLQQQQLQQLQQQIDGTNSSSCGGQIAFTSNNITPLVTDTLLMQLEERFHDFCEIVANFHCLDPSQFLADNTTFSILCAIYDNDINHNEAVLEYETLKNQQQQQQQYMTPTQSTSSHSLPSAPKHHHHHHHHHHSHSPSSSSSAAASSSSSSTPSLQQRFSLPAYPVSILKHQTRTISQQQQQQQLHQQQPHQAQNQQQQQQQIQHSHKHQQTLIINNNNNLSNSNVKSFMNANNKNANMNNSTISSNNNNINSSSNKNNNSSNQIVLQKFIYAPLSLPPDPPKRHNTTICTNKQTSSSSSSSSSSSKLFFKSRSGNPAVVRSYSTDSNSMASKLNHLHRRQQQQPQHQQQHQQQQQHHVPGRSISALNSPSTVHHAYLPMAQNLKIFQGSNMLSLWWLITALELFVLA